MLKTEEVVDFYCGNGILVGADFVFEVLKVKN